MELTPEAEQKQALIRKHEIHCTPRAFTDPIVKAVLDIRRVMSVRVTNGGVHLGGGKWVEIGSDVQTSPLAILEPSAGSGNFVRSLRDQISSESKITAVDIVPDFASLLTEAGANKVVIGDIVAVANRATANPSGPRFDLIIGNPAFSLVQPWCQALFPLLKPGGLLAFLVRSAFLNTKDRRDFWKEVYAHTLPSLVARIPLERRPSFEPPPGWPPLLNSKGKKRGSDTWEYEVMIWRQKSDLDKMPPATISLPPLITE